MLTFAADDRRAVAVPLGGIGTGQVAVRGDGSHDQWQLPNTIHHRTPAPGTFLGLRTAALGSGRPADHHARVLRGDPGAEPDAVPTDSTDWIAAAPTGGMWPGVGSTRMEVSYPFVRVQYLDDTLPVDVSTEMYTPFVPGDTAASSLPAIDYRISLTNRSALPQFGFAVFATQNTIGWDGVSPIDGVSNGRYGGNVNRLVQDRRTTAIVMDNPALRDDDPFAGDQAVWTDAPCWPLVRSDGPTMTQRAVESLSLIDAAGRRDYSDPVLRASLARFTPPVTPAHGPSAPGRTWDAALCAAWMLEPGESRQIRFVHAWRFGNRYVDFLQQYTDYGPGGRHLWVGNDYATRFGRALDVVRHLDEHGESLRAASREWADAVDTADVPDAVRDQITRQTSFVRNPTTFRTADGRFFGHEGGNGASTEYWAGAVGGSCPVNCNHVWNYAHTVAALFPDLERTMRRTEWEAQAPEGYVPHRIALPRWLPQYHGRPIGGPLEPALDGMLGAVLKTLREARLGGGVELLHEHWDAVRGVLDYVERTWLTNGALTDGDGILRGPQPTTFDYPFTGPNMFIGSFWLAALAAGSVIADAVGAPADAAHWNDLREQSSKAYDALLWNGEYYEQVDPGDELDYGTGCLSDQLIGQWWAFQLDLGELLPADRLRTAVASILRYNDRAHAPSTDLGGRQYADADDGGLVNCSWPRGDRPDKPVLYRDESWTGTEYQVIALAHRLGLRDEAVELLAVVQARHDGSRRNPFNEIECGDHYVRAMSGWSVVDAVLGVQYDGLTRQLRVASPVGTVPWVAAGAWGEVTRTGSGVTVTVRHGSLPLSHIVADGVAIAVDVEVLEAGQTVEVPWVRT